MNRHEKVTLSALEDILAWLRDLHVYHLEGLTANHQGMLTSAEFLLDTIATELEDKR